MKTKVKIEVTFCGMLKEVTNGGGEEDFIFVVQQLSQIYTQQPYLFPF